MRGFSVSGFWLKPETIKRATHLDRRLVLRMRRERCHLCVLVGAAVRPAHCRPVAWRRRRRQRRRRGADLAQPLKQVDAFAGLGALPGRAPLAAAEAQGACRAPRF